MLRGSLATWAIPKRSYSRGFDIVGRHVSRSPGFSVVCWKDDWNNICVCLAIAWMKGYFTEKAPPFLYRVSDVVGRSKYPFRKVAYL